MARPSIYTPKIFYFLREMVLGKFMKNRRYNTRNRGDMVYVYPIHRKTDLHIGRTVFINYSHCTDLRFSTSTLKVRIRRPTLNASLL